MLIKKALILIPMSFLLSSCLNPVFSSDKADYNEYYSWLVGNGDFHSQLYTFPESPNQDDITDFGFGKRDSLFTGDYYLYLEVQYTPAKYADEIDRLSKVKTVFNGGASKKILSYNENSLFLAIYKDSRFEYAVCNAETHVIGYVSNQLYQFFELNIKKEYKIDTFNIDESVDDGSNSYNMYYLYQHDPYLGDVGEYVSD